MTNKELLYVEDVLGHEKHFQSQCRETARQLQDPELRQCVEQMAKKHQQIFSAVFRPAVREGCQNERQKFHGNHVAAGEGGL